MATKSGWGWDGARVHGLCVLGACAQPISGQAPYRWWRSCEEDGLAVGAEFQCWKLGGQWLLQQGSQIESGSVRASETKALGLICKMIARCFVGEL